MSTSATTERFSQQIEEVSTAPYTSSFNAVKNAEAIGKVLFTSFSGSQAGVMEYFDRMTIVVTGPDTYQVSLVVGVAT
ncbi:hypothetical protein I6N95_07635 [Vagococcus sp. BWB3-3]|uniref:Uncharacterized protein n=1 Tax=Vagococcus allomyrinae TaxID=2794353 RepID=A0A940SW02_9ENTE|nr:hypothetical protein [Vagococcus allomyrinae]MBP1040873.1 hypothetical protein [Vagococcus allomyrinae]